MTHLLVVGLGVTGEALARHAAASGWSFTVVEDHGSGPGHAERAASVGDRGGRVVVAPDDDELRRLVAEADLVVPSPGVPSHHPVYAAAAVAGVALVSEIELAAGAAGVPIVAVTGTNGKTTVTSLVARMLRESGLEAAAAGNIGRPLIEVVTASGEGQAEPAVEAVVVEVSSFQLQYTRTFAPDVAVLLNVSEDHLDWHPTFEHYRQAKARVFANQGAGDLLVVNADDPVAAELADSAPGGVVRCTLDGGPGDWRVAGGDLLTPGGDVLCRADELPRAEPHDLLNALCASAAATAAGGSSEAAAEVLRTFEGLPHRLTTVGDAGGVRYVDDSKATNPHAALAAISSFDSVVLVAGGRNKGLGLERLAVAAPRLRHVVAFGDAAAELVGVFEGKVPVERAGTMREAVEAARRHANPGDTVLLSPACSSHDAYPDYAARGDDFASQVRRLLAADAVAADDAAGGDG